MPSDTRDIDAFRTAHPTIEMVDVVIADNHGVPRGKRVPADKLAAMWRDGVLFPESIFSLDRAGDTVDAAGLGVARGDVDHPCLPLPHSLTPVPWRDGLGQVQVTMRGPNGGGFFADPRQVLENVLGHFHRDGWQPVAAVEMEFYLLDAAAGPDGQPRPPRGEISGRRAANVDVYSLDDLNDNAACLTAIEAAARAQGLPLSAVVSENAPSQFEINLTHRADPVRAADEAMLLKRLIKGVAHSQGKLATFMAKPFADLPGNGTHVHVSVCDDAGANIFADPARADGAAQLRHAIAGLQATFAESLALLLPTPNAFKRLRFHGGDYAPGAATWGLNNRTVALRVPAGPPEARRVEHRIAGADANPYLVMAAVLAGIHHGLTARATPDPAIVGNAYDQNPSEPPTPAEAFAAFAAARHLDRYIGGDFRAVHLACLRAEHDRFEGHITPFERDQYLASS